MNSAPHDTMEIKNMVMIFRVTDLQSLLGRLGCNRYGKKKELLTRVIELLESSRWEETEKRIMELHRSRFPVSSSLTAHNDMENNNKGSGRPSFKKLDIRFISLPFYMQRSLVLHPTLLTFKYSNKMTDNISFSLSSSQCQELLAKSMSRYSSTRYQIQLRFCSIDYRNLHAIDTRDFLPADLQLKINNSTVFLPALITATKVGVEPKRPNLPIDITKYCRISQNADNKMEVRWKVDGEKHLAATVNIVTKLSTDDLIYELNSRAMCPWSAAKKLIEGKYSDSDVEIMTTSLKVSLLCPLGKMRMKTPVRSVTCLHLQCFDARLYFMMNEKKPTWLCPVCNKPAIFTDLRVDKLFTEILEECDGNDVEFDDDGQWRISKKKTETIVIGTPSAPIALDLSSSSSSNSVPRKKMDIIDLTVSSDEEDATTTVPSVISIDDVTVSSSPINVESPLPNYSRNGVSPKPRHYDNPRSDYPQHHYHHRWSPHHKSHSSVAKSRPPTQLSPYSRPPKSPNMHSRPPKSPNMYSRPPKSPNMYSHHSKSPNLSTPPLHRPPIISHSSPGYGVNGYVDTHPLPRTSPLVTATPPSSATPVLDPSLGLTGYQTPPLSLLGSDPSLQSLGYAPSHFDPASLYPFHRLYDFPNLLNPHSILHHYRTLQGLAPIREGSSQAPTYINDNLDDFTSDPIQID